MTEGIEKAKLEQRRRIKKHLNGERTRANELKRKMR
jgi:hypothetical protein